MNAAVPAILIIDDEEDFAQTLASRLELRGMSVRFVTSGESGLALLREHTPDLLLLDMRMPGLSGVDVLREVRSGGQIPDGKTLPVFIVSGHAFEKDFQTAEELGVQGCFSKPLQFQELYDRMVEVLRGRGRFATG